MSTKVISAKVSEQDYDDILNACNDKGCTISQFVKDSCLLSIGKTSEFSESVGISEKKDDDKIVSDLEGKITLLQLQLSNAKDTISRHEGEIKEFHELFSNHEIVDRRICKAGQRLRIANYMQSGKLKINHSH